MPGNSKIFTLMYKISVPGSPKPGGPWGPGGPCIPFSPRSPIEPLSPYKYKRTIKNFKHLATESVSNVLYE